MLSRVSRSACSARFFVACVRSNQKNLGSCQASWHGTDQLIEPITSWYGDYLQTVVPGRSDLLRREFFQGNSEERDTGWGVSDLALPYQFNSLPEG